MIDDQSEAGAWRREMLRQPLTVTQLREIVAELEHSLAVTRRDFEAMRRTNVDLVKRLAEAVAKEMEARGLVTRLERELAEARAYGIHD